jgi:hypothetical protein
MQTEFLSRCEGREQCRRAVTLVVVGDRPGAALLHRQAGLSAVERLDLDLFSSTERTTAWAGGSI